jgi:hypothetical protein
LLARIALATIMGIIVYVIIYLFFSVKGVIPPGDGLDKTDWLSFLGAYLSFLGTVIVSLTIFWHTNYVTKQSEEKTATERKKRIQPVFSIKIGSQNTVMEKRSSFVDAGNKPERPYNVIIKIENANEFPITNVIVFDKYITPLLKTKEEISVHCTYSDPTDTYKFYDSIAVINETDYEKDSSGLPKWFNINYDDVDGNEMYQSFSLHHFDKTPYYSSEGAIDV